MNNQGTLRSLQVIYQALLMGQVLFAILVFFLRYSGRLASGNVELDRALQVVALVFSFGGVFAGSSLFKKKIQQLRDSAEDIKTKAKAFRSASITQWALIEGPSLFNIICFMLTGNYAFLGLAAALILWFGLTMPTKTKIMLLLRVSEKEMEDF